MGMNRRRSIFVAILVVASSLMGACGGSTERVFYIGGIPDQDLSALEARFSGLAEYLTDCLGAFDKAVRNRRQWYGQEIEKTAVGPAPISIKLEE